MTSIVTIRCRDGVVIGADSAATLGDGAQLRTIEQPTGRKIEIVGETVIVAGTGYVGHGQRFNAVVRRLYQDKAFQGKTGMEIAKLLCREALDDFLETRVTHLNYSAFVAYVAEDKPCLCEFPGGQAGFQPEMKDRQEELWFASAGSGQAITDSLLALFRQVFWHGGAPNLQGGIFATLWALRHACDVNPGGIQYPEHIAVLAREKGKLRARKLDEDELAQHRDMVSGAIDHMARFREVVEGTSGEVSDPPLPPKAQP